MILVAMACLTQAGETNSRDAFFWSAKIGRGINLGNILEAPKQRAKHVRLKEAYFDLIAGAGFDSVRIPVRWSDYADESPPYTIDPEFMARVDWAIEQVLKRRMVAIVNIHHYHGFMEDPVQHKARVLGIWKQLSEHYRNQPPVLYFEIMNEPSRKVTAGIWNEVQNEVIKLIRKTNPQRAILVAPLGWNRIEQLQHLALPPGDRNLIASIHYYEPFDFTHQGAGWVHQDIPVGTPWAGNEEERQAIIDDFTVASNWSDANHIPIHMGEFGAYNKADMESRVRWTGFVREEAEKHGMSWSYWEFCSSFGIYDPDQEIWRRKLLQSLLPESSGVDIRRTL